jgi:hypothetical protein
VVRIRLGGIARLLAAGAGAALAFSTAGAANQTVTLGSTSGTPSANICEASINCTYVPFTGVSNPGLQVPFDGTVTSFSVNAGNAGGTVELRVLRPAAPGQYTGAGTSSPKTLGLGMSTFAVSLPVKAGDLLGLDNESSALIFDTSSASPITAYYEVPPLIDGKTAAPNYNKTGYRLLLSATVQAATTTTGTTPTSTGPGGTTPTGTTPTGSPPTVTEVTQSSHVWREGNKLAQISRRKSPRVGTTFSFSLNEQASVSFSFTQKLAGRKVGARCIPQTHRNRGKPACKRTLARGTLTFTGHSGTNRVVFQGRISRSKKLKPGRYTLIITATNSASARSTPVPLSFTIVN